MLVGTVHWWLALVSVDGLLVTTLASSSVARQALDAGGRSECSKDILRN